MADRHIPYTILNSSLPGAWDAAWEGGQDAGRRVQEPKPHLKVVAPKNSEHPHRSQKGSADWRFGERARSQAAQFCEDRNGPQGDTFAYIPRVSEGQSLCSVT